MARNIVATACLAFLAVAAPCLAAEKVDASGDRVTFTAQNAEIVIPEGATPVVRFAAKEAKTFLSAAFGKDVPVVKSPSEGKASLVLGANA